MTRAEAAEAANSTAIVSEASRAELAEEGLFISIESEMTRAEAAEAANSTAIFNEATTARSAESLLAENINAEETRAETAEGANSTAIVNEASRAELAEEGLSTAIVSENSRAEAAEAANSTAIVNLDTDKFAKSDNYEKRVDGNLQIDGNGYLYISDAWRIHANLLGDKKKLEFQYYDEVLTEWVVGVPFVRQN